MRLSRSALTAVCTALLLASPIRARGAEVFVTVQEFNFSPRRVDINVGDTVTWTWIDGFHSTTSGTGGDDPKAGALWDAFLFAGQETVSYTFTSPGRFPFFCRFHEALDMKGVVRVAQPSIASSREKGPDGSEPASWGAIKSLYR